MDRGNGRVDGTRPCDRRARRWRLWHRCATAAVLVLSLGRSGAALADDTEGVELRLTHQPTTKTAPSTQPQDGPLWQQIEQAERQRYEKEADESRRRFFSVRLPVGPAFQDEEMVRALDIYSPAMWSPQDTRAYVGFDWANQRYLPHSRAARDDRLFYYEKRLTAGLRWEIGTHGYLDVFGGYAFDRMFFEAHRYEGRDRHRLDIADGPFFGIQVGLRF